MRPKTRQKIIDAALSELARNPAASLDHIATVAEVSRITVFRYFSNREQLMFALNQEVNRVFMEIMEPIISADLPSAAKLEKLVITMIPYGATFRFLLYEPYRTGDPRTERQLQDYLDSLHRLIRALDADGLLGGHVPTWWAARHLDALLWMAWDSIEQGELAVKAAPDIILQTFYHGAGICGGPK